MSFTPTTNQSLNPGTSSTNDPYTLQVLKSLSDLHERRNLLDSKISGLLYSIVPFVGNPKRSAPLARADSCPVPRTMNMHDSLPVMRRSMTTPQTNTSGSIGDTDFFIMENESPFHNISYSPGNSISPFLPHLEPPMLRIETIPSPQDLQQFMEPFNPDGPPWDPLSSFSHIPLLSSSPVLPFHPPNVARVLQYPPFGGGYKFGSPGFREAPQWIQPPTPIDESCVDTLSSCGLERQDSSGGLSDYSTPFSPPVDQPLPDESTEEEASSTSIVAKKRGSLGSGPSLIPFQSITAPNTLSKNPTRVARATSGTPYSRPLQQPVVCTLCESRPRFRGDHEYQRHFSRNHAQKRNIYIAKDISPQGDFLSGCRACQNKKTYNRDDNLTAHLRRQHFQIKKSRKRGGRPNMEEVKRLLDSWNMEWRDSSGGFSINFCRNWMQCIELDAEADRSDTSLTIVREMEGLGNYQHESEDEEAQDDGSDIEEESSRPNSFPTIAPEPSLTQAYFIPSAEQVWMLENTDFGSGGITESAIYSGGHELDNYTFMSPPSNLEQIHLLPNYDN